MKIAILGDTHYGMRNDSIPFHNYNRKFYEETFFPYLKAKGIKKVYQLGDLFDRRKFISFITLFLAKQYFFDRFEEEGIEFVTFVGNHDTFYKNTNEVNSIELVLKDYIDKGIIRCYTGPAQEEVDGTLIDIIPWICSDNEAEVKEFISKTKANICLGHFEIEGFEMDRGNVCVEGMSREELSKYELVLSGHFHHKSTDGHIVYVGTPGEMTWADYNDPRGFHIFDTDTRELEFIQNPNRMFHKIIYDDKHETFESIDTHNYAQYENTMVKVVVVEKTNPVLFNKFIDALYKASPLDISIVEDFTDYTEVSDEDVVNQADDTPTTLDKFIDAIEAQSLNKDKMKNIMREIYLEAQHIEVA